MSTINSAPVLKRQGSNLSCWRFEGAAYHCVFRLADSVPDAVAKTWAEERAVLLSNAKRSPQEVEAQLRAMNRRAEKYLDSGYGSKLLARPKCADNLRSSLRYLQGERYHLYAWCIMPNHVHVLVEPFAGYELSDILKSWKAVSTPLINSSIGRQGPLWSRESYDQILRSPASFERAVNYVRTNPEKAGLTRWTWVSPIEDALGRQPRWLA